MDRQLLSQEILGATFLDIRSASSEIVLESPHISR